MTKTQRYPSHGLASVLQRRPLFSLATGALLAATWLAAVPAVRASDAPAAAEQDDESALAESLLALKVRTSLLTKLGLDGTRVDVSASGAKITLSGEVKERATQEIAKEVALGVEGVKEVDNRISVKASGSSETPVAGAVANAEREVNDAALETKVKGRLISELGKYGLRIEVEASDGVVSLRGTLPDKGREEIALDTAKAASGVREVVDLIDVVKK